MLKFFVQQAAGPRCAVITASQVRSIHRGGESDASGIVNHRDEEQLTTQRSRVSGKRWLNYDVTSSKPTPASVRERNIAVTSYYNQTGIDSAIEKVNLCDGER